MALRAGGSGTGRAPSTGDAGNPGPALGSLGSALDAAFNDLAANPESGGEVRLPRQGEPDPEHEEREEEQEPDESEEEESESESEGGESKAPPAKTPPPSPTAKPAGEETPSAAEGSPAAQAAPVADVVDVAALLQDYSPDELDAIRKFLPKNSLTGVTKEAFREAKAKVAADYWRIQKDNAAKLKPEGDGGKDKETPSDSTSKPEAKEPTEVAHLSVRMQEINADGVKAKAQIEAWSEAIFTAQSKVTQLEAQRAEGEPIDSDQIAKAYRELTSAQRTKAGWEKYFNQRKAEYFDVENRKKEVLLSVETREAVTRQEKERQDRDSATKSQEFFDSWKTTLTKVAGEKGFKDPNSARFKHLMKAVRDATSARIQRAAFNSDEIEPFIKEEVEAYAQAHAETEAEVKKSYAETKAGDAPKVPDQAKRPKAKKAGRSESSANSERSLRELENKLFKNEAWKNL